MTGAIFLLPRGIFEDLDCRAPFPVARLFFIRPPAPMGRLRSVGMSPRDAVPTRFICLGFDSQKRDSKG